MDSIGSPELLAAGVFRESGSALQNYPIAIPQELFDVISSVTLGLPQIRAFKRDSDDGHALEAVLSNEYLDGVPTVELLQLLVKSASTLRRCKVDPSIGIGLFCVTLNGTLKLDVWRNANTLANCITSADFDQGLGNAIKAILALSRPYDFQLTFSFVVGC